MAKKTALRAWTDEDEARLQKIVADDPDDWISTPEEMAQARPFKEVHPGMFVEKRGRGRPRLDAPKVHVSIRLDDDVLAAYKEVGSKWQTLINDVLRGALEPYESPPTAKPKLRYAGRPSKLRKAKKAASQVVAAQEPEAVEKPSLIKRHKAKIKEQMATPKKDRRAA